MKGGESKAVIESSSVCCFVSYAA
uniref:Uncharacterized protein n=1 Tax=Anguilla anguilla TaxID=7936 RepID=A0A0E9PVZ3_ANGAN